MTAVTASNAFLDHSHLKPGAQASLLSYEKTIDMYRENANKTHSPEIQCDFAVFLVETAKQHRRFEYLAEAEKLLRQLAGRGHAESQYYLGNLYAAGVLDNRKHKAFPLFVQAAKHHHADAAYRAAKCFEEGVGCRKDNGKSIQFYKKAAAQLHPEAMYRLGTVQLRGQLGVHKNVADGVKWLKCASDQALPQAVYDLAMLHENGIPPVIFTDHAYCVSLLQEAANTLQHTASAFRLGEAYQHGKLTCPQDPALSIHYYTLAAQRGHPDACFALAQWCLAGSPEFLPRSESLAYTWALRAAEMDHPRAAYLVGHLVEHGAGVSPSQDAAVAWYQRAAQQGHPQAHKRLGQVKATKKKKDDDCALM